MTEILIGLGILYLAIGGFLLVIFAKMGLSGFSLGSILKTIFLWLPIWVGLVD